MIASEQGQARIHDEIPPKEQERDRHEALGPMFDMFHRFFIELAVLLGAETPYKHQSRYGFDKRVHPEPEKRDRT